MLAGVEVAERLGLPIIVPTSRDEVRTGMQWWTYRNDKARTELGFQPRPHEETLEDTVRWQLDELGDRVSGHQLTDAAMRGAGAALRMLPFGVLG